MDAQLNYVSWNWEGGPWLRALNAFAEDLRLVPSINMVANKPTVPLDLGGVRYLLLASTDTRHA